MAADHRQRMFTAAYVFGWGAIALSAAAALTWSHQHDDAHLVAISGWAAAGAANMLAVMGLTQGARRFAAVRDNMRVGQLALYVSNIVVQTGLVASAGGLDTALWLVFLPTVIFAALNASKRQALAWGVVSSAGLGLAAAWSRTLDSEHATTALVALVLFPALSWYLGTLSGALLDMRTDARVARAGLVERVNEISDLLSRTAQGDLTAAPQRREDDREIAPLVDALDSTVVDLRGLVSQLRDSGSMIRTGATEVLATAEQQAAAATQQSSAVQETTATIEELAATAAQIAETSEAVARYAEQTLQHAEVGQDAVAASVASMDKIASSVDGIAKRALSLGTKSEQIGRILEVINELADQTELLALNAAIEAARAGEQGRGFAVVATEVRKLAERAQQSTGKIRDLVLEIQSETQATIRATEEGAREVLGGAALAQDVVKALDEIKGMVDETTTAAKEISIATQQQRTASDQVVAAMTQVADASRQYAGGSRQAALAAAQLTELADGLTVSMGRFVTS